MRVNDIQDQMSNYSEFKSAVGRYGFSINNFYDVRFEIQPSSPLFAEIAKTNELNLTETRELMKLYTDETSIPGIQLSTGEYRVTNTPTLKYAYGAVFSEAQFSFIMDADSRIKGVFDVWTNWMYGYSSRTEEIVGPLVRRTPKMRTRYRDEYAVDIVIIKYERSMSSHANAPAQRDPNFSLREIIPGHKNSGGTKFYKAVPVYAVRLFNAFPSNISSMQLNSGTSELSKLSVTFEYETMTTSALNEGSINGSIIDPINGGGDNLTDQIFNGLLV